MSKRITKIMAANAALNMARLYLNDELEKAKEELSAYATCVVYALVPKDVIDVTEKYEKYVDGLHSVLFYAFDNNVKLQDAYATINCVVPHGSDYLEVDVATYKKLMKLKKVVINLDDKRRKFRDELKNALYSLGTKEKIEKTLPNALKYLDFEESEKKSLPVSNYTNLQQIISKL